MKRVRIKSSPVSLTPDRARPVVAEAAAAILEGEKEEEEEEGKNHFSYSTAPRQFFSVARVRQFFAERSQDMPPRVGAVAAAAKPKAQQRVKKAKEKVYAVRRGHRLGAFATWGECERHTRGFPGSQFKSFDTLDQAIAYLAVGGVVIDGMTVEAPEMAAAAKAANQVRLAAISDMAPRVVADAARVPKFTYPRRIYCDGGQNKQTGAEAWGCVVDENAADLVLDGQALLADLPMRVADLPEPAGRRWVLVSQQWRRTHGAASWCTSRQSCAG
jgi:hypothetical protein